MTRRKLRNKTILDARDVNATPLLAVMAVRDMGVGLPIEITHAVALIDRTEDYRGSRLTTFGLASSAWGAMD